MRQFRDWAAFGLDHLCGVLDHLPGYHCQMLNDWPTRRLWWWALELPPRATRSGSRRPARMAQGATTLLPLPRLSEVRGALGLIKVLLGTSLLTLLIAADPMNPRDGSAPTSRQEDPMTLADNDPAWSIS